VLYEHPSTKSSKFMKNGNSRFILLWLLGCLVYLVNVQEIKAGDMRLHLVQHLRGPYYSGDQWYIYVQNQNVSQSGSPNTIYFPDPSGPYSEIVFTLNDSFWNKNDVVDISCSYQAVVDGPILYATYTRQIIEFAIDGDLYLDVYFGGTNAWFFRDTVQNNLQLSMEVTYYDNVVGGTVVLGGPYLVVPGASKSVVFGPFEEKHNISTTVKWFDGEIVVINESTNNAAWWDEGNGGHDPLTNQVPAKMPDVPVPTSTNLNNINWGTAVTNTGQNTLAQEVSIRQGFENLKAVAYQAALNDQANASQQKADMAMLNSNVLNLAEMISLSENRQSNWNQGISPTGLVSQIDGSWVADAGQYGSNAMYNSFSPIYALTNGHGPVAPFYPENINEDFWKIHVQNHVIDCNPLNNARIAAIFAAVKSVFTWLIRIFFLICNVWFIRWTVEAVWKWKQAKVINVTIGGCTVNIVVAGIIIVFILATISSALAAIFGYIGSNIAGEVFASIYQNPFTGESSLWQAVPGVITLVNAAFPVGLFLGYLSALVVTSITIFGLALVSSGVLRAIPGN